jgi:hypothetical protein
MQKSGLSEVGAGLLGRYADVGVSFKVAVPALVA